MAKHQNPKPADTTLADFCHFTDMIDGERETAQAYADFRAQSEYLPEWWAQNQALYI